MPGSSKNTRITYFHDTSRDKVNIMPFSLGYSRNYNIRLNNFFIFSILTLSKDV
jgi:hypothetical protein